MSMIRTGCEMGAKNRCAINKVMITETIIINGTKRACKLGKLAGREHNPVGLIE